MTSSAKLRLAEAFAKVAALTGLPDHRAFERLAAMVLHRWLGERVVHDITLRGVSTAPHQIDVLVGDERQRALIECKYYDRKIDMPVIRNFYGAVEDVGCDMAAIVTTVGFSKNVVTYGKAKGIDLLLLRNVEEQDLENKILAIQLELTAFHVGLRNCRVEQVAGPDDEPSEERVRIALDDPSVVLEHASGKVEPFRDRYDRHFGSFGLDKEDGLYPVADVFEAETWLRRGSQRVQVRRIDWEWLVSRSTTTSEVRHEPLVTLVDADGDVLEMVTEEQLAQIRFERSDGATPGL